MPWVEPAMWVVGFTVVASLFGILGAMAGRYEFRRSDQPLEPSKPREAVPADYAARFEQLTNAVDAIALEVERLGEGQRFVTKLLSDANRLPRV